MLRPLSQLRGARGGLHFSQDPDPFSASYILGLVGIGRDKSGEASSQVGGKAGDIHGDAIQGEEKEGDAMMAESEERIVEVHTSSSGHRVGRGKDQ